MHVVHCLIVAFVGVKERSRTVLTVVWIWCANIWNKPVRQAIKVRVKVAQRKGCDVLMKSGLQNVPAKIIR